jgi:ABC-type multidrug transport system ATPase subunit
MNRLEVTGLGKKFYRQWIFRGLDFSIETGERVLLHGDNGSGKSTLMRILSGQLTPTEGKLELYIKGKSIDPEDFYRYLSWSGPYMDLYTDLTLTEAIRLHASLRKMVVDARDVPGLLQLEDHANKMLKHFSSGMLHRVKVGLAILTSCELLLLDEATTNMDEANSKLVMDLMAAYLAGRMLVFASNKPEEFGMFERRVGMNEVAGRR